MEEGNSGAVNVPNVDAGGQITPSQPNSAKNSKSLIVLIAIAVILVGASIVAAIIFMGKEKPNNPSPAPSPVKPNANYSSDSNLFAVNYFKNAYAAEKSYSNTLISPYSMEAVWQIAGKGAGGNTKTQIYDMLGTERTMPEIAGLHSANAAFIRETIADKIKNEFLDAVNGDIVYDPFTSPDTMNAWVKDNTNGMIPKIFDNAPDGDMVLANAIAMEQEWNDKFECEKTRGVDFTNSEGETVEASMMAGEANYYFKTDNSEGIVRNYKASDNGDYLEFVAFKPNNSVSSYISDLFESDLKSFDEKLIAPSSSDEKVVTVGVSLPRFSYDYTVPDLVKMFSTGMGVSDAFNSEKADFSGISDSMSFYVSDLIQKTHVEMSETGTRAAAVTAMVLDVTSAYQEEPEYVHYHVDFDKSFVYMIRDHKTKEIIFTGVVEHPELMSDYDGCIEVNDD
ncbi:MAG: serpin family protein [Candidatus Saccharibacteria bacterium]|nr:serpin family protein [Candidatus Saccharibacteria bacterium]